MILGQLGLRHRAGRRRARRRRDRRRLRGPEPRPRLPQRRADPDREPVRQGRRRPGRRASTGRSRTSRLRRTTLRDLDGVVHTVPNGEIKVASNLTRVWARINQDVTVAYGTDIDKAIARRRRGRPGDGRRSGLEAAGPRGAARRADRGPGRVRRDAQDPRDRPRGRPVGGRAATSASGSSRRSRPTASRSRGRSASCCRATPTPIGRPRRRGPRPGRPRRADTD